MVNRASDTPQQPGTKLTSLPAYIQLCNPSRVPPEKHEVLPGCAVGSETLLPLSPPFQHLLLHSTHRHPSSPSGCGPSPHLQTLGTPLLLHFVQKSLPRLVPTPLPTLAPCILQQSPGSPAAALPGWLGLLLQPGTEGPSARYAPAGPVAVGVHWPSRRGARVLALLALSPGPARRRSQT